MSETKSSFKVPILGKKIKTANDFLTWERKFRGLAAANGFDSALSSSIALPLRYTDHGSMPETNDVEKAKKKAIKTINVAMAFLHQAVETSTAEGCLTKACDAKYPNGVAHIALANLEEKYAKNDSLTASTLRQKLTRLKMKASDDPTDMFEKVAAIKNQASKIKDDVISEQEVCSKIMIAAPKEYMLGIRAVQIARGAAMTVDHLEKEMCGMYRMFHLQEEDNEDSDDDEDTKETALTTPGAGWAKFKGRCYRCDKAGHRAHECPEKKSKESNKHGNEKESENPAKFEGTCNGCGKYGHRQSECWRNKGGEKNLAAKKEDSDDSDVEFMLMTVNVASMTSQKAFPDCQLVERPKHHDCRYWSNV